MAIQLRQDPRQRTKDSQQPHLCRLPLRSETRFRVILTKCLVYQEVQERSEVSSSPSTSGVLFPSDTASQRSWHGSAGAWPPQPGRAPRAELPELTATRPWSLDRPTPQAHQSLGPEKASRKVYSRRKSPCFGSGWTQVWLLTLLHSESRFSQLKMRLDNTTSLICLSVKEGNGPQQASFTKGRSPGRGKVNRGHTHTADQGATRSSLL